MGSFPVNVEGNFTPVAYAFESITVSSAVKTLTVATYMPQAQGITAPVAAWITCKDAAIRYRLDNVDPSATVGHYLDDGDGLMIGSGSVQRFRAILDTAAVTDAIISVTYFQAPASGRIM